jgi:predicted metal-dependent hydrolase
MFKSFFDSDNVTNIALDDIDFKVKHTIRKNMRRIVLRVENKNEIHLTSSKVSKKKIQSFLIEQKEWILDRNSNLHLPFAKGTTFHYLANEYTINHHDGDVIIDKNCIYINPFSAKKSIDDFYKSKAIQYLPARVDYWKDLMGLKFDVLRFRFAKRRWGSCNSKGVITLNPYMMKLDYNMIDYIIVHELAHLEHLNHSKQFYALVKAYVPEYIDIQKRINELSLQISN